MRKRTLLTVALIGLMLVIALLGLLLVILVRDRGEEDNTLVTAEEVKKQKKEVIVDPYAGRGADAINMVKQHQVYDPAYVKATLDQKKKAAADEAPEQVEPEKKKSRRDKKREKKEAKEQEEQEAAAAAEAAEIALIPKSISVEELVDQKYLEERFNMSFLERGNWRALQLETDSQDEVRDDPYFEVSLDYKDEEVTVGPVWIVNVETGDVVPRNEMAAFFEFTPENADQAEELLTRPERVVKAITNHRFDSQIELGGVLLLHFMNNTAQKEGDRVIGWTVSHEFRDQYNAYFQWTSGGEHKVARFVFDWAEQRLEPRGLVAIDLMAEGESRTALDPVDIWPTTYKNELNIPREARWVGDDHACKDKANKEICDSFAMVLEQDDFIESVQWLLTTDKEMKKEFEQCAVRKECMWAPKPADDGTFEITYKYKLNDTPHELSFKVDPKNQSIIPVNPITEWAFWSVTPRT